MATAEEEKALESLPDEDLLSEYTQVDKMEICDGRHKVLIMYKEGETPIGDMFLEFSKPLTSSKAKETILKAAIKNGVLNVLNDFATIKDFFSFSDYIVLVGLIDGQEKVREQLYDFFDFYLKPYTDEEYQKELAARNEANKVDAEAEVNTEAEANAEDPVIA